MRNREKSGSLTYQVQQCLQSKLAIGESNTSQRQMAASRRKSILGGLTAAMRSSA